MPVQTSASITVDAPVAKTFDAAAGIDARALVQKHGPLPGIVNIEGQDAPWSAVGQKRHMTLTDGSTVDEELTTFSAGNNFAYRVTKFSGVFAALVDHASGEWHFTTLGADKTRIDWTYKFFPKGMIAEPVLWFVVKLLWPGYLNTALKRLKQKAETPNE